ncbi:AAA family ATPase [Flagellimonas lutimaris]|uniref:AAA family ATPase n=1 Tax=Flagellimonas lutimaris TaxID=475082 RepID=A0A3A1N4W0_9FLAO|nr:AAA family ATPase [Allomuricauda lutimaris]RIV31535.1 AAA family ATPase [Allomuricauda lutimaris]
MGGGNHILSKGHMVDGLYEVAFFIKKGRYAESYRVRDQKGHSRFLKLFHYPQLDRTQFDKQGNIVEIEVLKQVEHPNLVEYFDYGEVVLDSQKFAYVVLNFISGETLMDKLKREHTFNWYEANSIIKGVLNGLRYLHSLSSPVIHNDINHLNVMLDLTSKVAITKIIDFGYARYLEQSNLDFLKTGLNPFYQASETFNNVFSVQSDLFSIGALYYHLLEGLPPWFVDIPKYGLDQVKLENIVLEERRKPLRFTRVKDVATKSILRKALNSDTENRFKTASAFIEAMNGELLVEPLHATNGKKTKKKMSKKGKGFGAIAGMQPLKDMVQLDVIDALTQKERYASYGLTIPNGMLLYGPPGCGKTYFAERMAEEIGFDFYQIKPSDIQSKWVNASQENIKNLFEEARQHAPSLIFIDELDAVVPNRDDSGISHMNTSVVNEMLAQMNNCGEDGLFIVAATNRPLKIDPAILRSGRLDRVIYLPPPDLEARKKMFELYLEKRPREVGINFLKIAKATDKYVSSDIKFLCDEAARIALKSSARISEEILLKTIKANKPSINERELKSYLDIKAKMEGIKDNNSDRPRIGFKKD